MARIYADLFKTRNVKISKKLFKKLQVDFMVTAGLIYWEKELPEWKRGEIYGTILENVKETANIHDCIHVPIQNKSSEDCGHIEVYGWKKMEIINKR